MLCGRFKLWRGRARQWLDIRPFLPILAVGGRTTAVTAAAVISTVVTSVFITSVPYRRM